MNNTPNYMAWIPANVRYDKDLSANAKLLFGEISALTNAKGYCWATNGYFAELYGVTKTSISLWIKQLVDKGYVTMEIIYKEGTKEILNRYLRIFNDPIKENLDTPTQENLNTPPQKNLKENDLISFNDSSINDTSNNKKINKKNKQPSGIEKEFETLWKMYPRKIGKAKALQSYKKARKKEGNEYETVLNGLNRYITYIQNRDIDEQYIMHGSTWFNQLKWHDEYTCIATTKKVTSYLDYYNAKFGGESNGFSRHGEVIEHDSTYLSEPF